MFMNQKPVAQGVLLGVTATSLYTVPANTMARLSSVTFTNQTTTPRKVSVYLVPEGGAATTSNRVLAPYVIGSEETWTCPHLNHNLSSGAQLMALADAADAVSVYASAVEMSKA